MDQVLFGVAMLVLGAGAGVINGALGLGGGIIMVPAFMSFVPGMDAHTAKGTSLFLIVFVALLNAWRQNHGRLDKPWRLAGFLAGGSVVGSYAGAWLTSLMPESVVLGLFLVLLAGVALRTFLLEAVEVHEAEVRKRRVLPVFIGLAAGLVGGATGTGGGAVLVPLALMAGLVTNARVVALSNMVMVATSAAGSVAHLRAAPFFDAPWTVGHVYFMLVPFVFLGSQLGSPLGTYLNKKLTLRWRRVVMGMLLLLITARLGYRLLA